MYVRHLWFDGTNRKTQWLGINFGLRTLLLYGIFFIVICLAGIIGDLAQWSYEGRSAIIWSLAIPGLLLIGGTELVLRSKIPALYANGLIADRRSYAFRALETLLTNRSVLLRQLASHEVTEERVAPLVRGYLKRTYSANQIAESEGEPGVAARLSIDAAAEQVAESIAVEIRNQELETQAEERRRWAKKA